MNVPQLSLAAEHRDATMRQQSANPFVIVSTVDVRKSRNLPKSMLCKVALMPIRSALSYVLRTCAAVSNAFDGMQPRLRQVPPNVLSRSMSATVFAELRGTQCRGISSHPAR